MLLTGKNKVVSGAAITLKNTLDFGTDKVQRIQIDALAKKATKTYMEVYLDDAVTPTVRVRIPNQPKADSWTRTKVYSYEFAEKEKLTGKHTVRVQLQDETTAADKRQAYCCVLSSSCRKVFRPYLLILMSLWEALAR